MCVHVCFKTENAGDNTTIQKHIHIHIPVPEINE